MKKILMAALVVVMAFAAQAITVGWQQPVKNETTANGLSVLDVYANRPLSVAAEITYGASIGTGTLFSVGASKDGNRLSVRVNNKGNYEFVAENMTTGATKEFSSGPTAKKTDVIGMAFHRGADQTASVELSLNGTLVDTVNIKFKAGPVKWLEWGRKVGNEDEYSKEYSMNMDYIEQKVTASDINYQMTVPEPTVLALLALGVAGLALKRKVA